jgi:hypothetical protein
MLWIVLGIVFTLWIIQFGFGLGGIYIPLLNAVIFLTLLIKLLASSWSAHSKNE